MTQELLGGSCNYGNRYEPIKVALKSLFIQGSKHGLRDLKLLSLSLGRTLPV